MDRLNIVSIKDELVRQEISIFSVKDFVRIFKTNSKNTRAFLSYNSAKGRFKRLKRDTYIVTSNPPTKFEIANRLVKPSYVSFETALSFYKIIPETVYTITSATPKITREYSNIINVNYLYRKIKKELFFGYTPLKIRNKTILIADKEKALLDYLYILSLNNKAFNERLDMTKIDKDILGKYINYFTKRIRKSKALIDLVRKLKI